MPKLMHMTSTFHDIPNFTSFQSTCGKHHIKDNL
jgi:hypothetical protein